MTRQKSEDRVVPKGRRKTVPTREIEKPAGGKAIPVNEQACQLNLHFETAEFPARAGAKRGAIIDPSMSVTRRVPKSKVKAENDSPATMDEVVKRLEGAFARVASNRGAPGPDRQTIEEVQEHLSDVIRSVSEALIAGTYQPGDIRRVWIPKSGGRRGLGIPNVVDRMVQEAVRMVLEPLYEPTFHTESHGFRPERSCHTAVVEARKHIEAGYEWVVDLDLEKFFDRVNHQRLMARLAERVHERGLLSLIGRMLKAKVGDAGWRGREHGRRGAARLSVVPVAQQHRAG
jgi:retron-type reverse transcriptase